MLSKSVSLIFRKQIFQQLSQCRNVLKFHTQQFPSLAGHSKWANIRHIKAQKDGQKATTFTRLARQIRLAIQEGGSSDPALNSTLRSVIEEALRKNMPMATIQNNIKKSQQNKNLLKKHTVQIRYKQKVYAVCILYTDNLPGLKMDMAAIVKKAGGVFVEASHLFDEFGLIEALIEPSTRSSDDFEGHVTEDAIECGAEEVEIVNPETGAVNFFCNIIELPAVRRSLEEKGYTINNTEHVFAPKTVVQLTEEEQKPYEAFLQKLRGLSGFENVYDNVETLESST